MSGVAGYVGWIYSILCFVVVCVLLSVQNCDFGSLIGWFDDDVIVVGELG